MRAIQSPTTGGCDFLESRRRFGAGFGFGAIPCSGTGLGYRTFAWGDTGYAINPARDFGPRLAHAVLPVAGKGPSDWDYAVVPILGPLIGGGLGGLLLRAVAR